MMPTRIAYMPLATYPEAASDESILAAAGFAAALASALHVTTFSVDIPRMYSPLGGLLLDVPGLVRASEEKSKAECRRLQGLVEGVAKPNFAVHCSNRDAVLGAARDVAAVESRYYDLAVLPWSADTMTAQEMAESVVFGSGRPTVLVPPSTAPAALDHVAIAWDASRVAARALGDALPLLASGGRVSVLTIQDEKPLSGANIANALVSSLEKRGFSAKAVQVALGQRTIAETLQASALSEGAQVLAMGGFGHSRLRDFVLGGATKGVFTKLQLPVLLSH